MSGAAVGREANQGIKQALEIRIVFGAAIDSKLYCTCKACDKALLADCCFRTGEIVVADEDIFSSIQARKLSWSKD